MNTLSVEQLRTLRGTHTHVGLLCDRCFQLRTKGSVCESLRNVCVNETHTHKHTNTHTHTHTHKRVLPHDTFTSLISTLQHKRCIFLYVLDVFDLQVIPNIARLVHNRPLVVVANKLDLLAHNKFNRRHLLFYLHSYLKEKGLDHLKPRNIFLASSLTGESLNLLFSVISNEVTKYTHKDVYIIGAANCGKSTFVNQILGLNRNVKYSHTKAGVTVSRLPGTTLDFVPIRVANKFKFYDSPGVMLEGQYHNLLEQEELKDVIPKKNIHKYNIRMQPHTALEFGGLARFELLGAKAFQCIPHVSDSIPMYVTANTYNTWRPSMIPTSFTHERIMELRHKFVTRDLEFDGQGWRDGCADIVIPGLGFVSLTGCGLCRVRVSAPENVAVHSRPPILPKESLEGKYRNLPLHLNHSPQKYSE